MCCSQRVHFQRNLVETGIQLSWNLRFGASAKARHKRFDWRTLIYEDQSITQGQVGFNQRLMKNNQVLKVVSVSVSLSAKALSCLPSVLMGFRELGAGCLPRPRLRHSCRAGGSSCQLMCSSPGAPMRHRRFGFQACSSSAVGCPAAAPAPVSCRTARA